MKLRENAKVKEGAIEKAKKVTFVVIDIHGVLTDNTLYYTPEGIKSERFSLRDRIGFKLLHEAGIRTAFLTSKISRADQAVSKIYGVPEEFLWGSSQKMALTTEMQNKYGFRDEEMCYIGDEMIDLGMMRRAGFSVAPQDASKEAKEIADLVTEAKGGQGVVREVAEFILRAQGKWDEVLNSLSL
ncbi:MAG: HAD hydrolase family protein [Desulfobacterota bacterium]|nr:HAD hydrolase family protein [Thermodesulfobacteriota bacterium]MDW8001872.1 HAD hydrolase family protein [Deltaproteobacteria bacterium]